MQPCNFVCDDCTRTLCTQGNPTLEPAPEDLEELLDKAEKELEEIKRELDKLTAGEDQTEGTT